MDKLIPKAQVGRDLGKVIEFDEGSLLIFKDFFWAIGTDAWHLSD